MEQENSAGKVALFAFVGIAVLAALAAVAWKLLQPTPVPAPTAYMPYTAPDSSFTCQAPSGWEISGASANGVAGAGYFESGTAKISVSSDLTGSLMGDVMRATSGMGGPQVPPVQKVHETGRKMMEDKFGNYDEGTAQPFMSAVGDSRFSEFTGDGGFRAGKIHGYRVTMLGGDRRFQVICQCSDTDWPNLKGAFVTVINSVRAGKM